MLRMTQISLVVVSMVLATFDACAQNPIQIDRVHDTAAERQVAAQLERLLQEYDLSKWIFTRTVRIDEEADAPYSHPILTLNVRNTRDLSLLSAFIHEQLHWFEEMHAQAREEAITALRAMFPDAPGGPPEGARSAYSTYLHLLVCQMEYEALTELVGADRATREMNARPYYTWIYRTVLNEGHRIRAVAQSHGLTLESAGLEQLP